MTIGMCLSFFLHSMRASTFQELDFDKNCFQFFGVCFLLPTVDSIGGWHDRGCHPWALEWHGWNSIPGKGADRIRRGWILVGQSSWPCKWLTRISISIKTTQFLCSFMCLFHPETSSLFVKSYPLLFLFLCYLYLYFHFPRSLIVQ